MTTETYTSLPTDNTALKQKLDLLDSEMHKVIVGQQHLLNKLKIGLLTNGHILLEGMPGLAKTLAIKSLSQAIGGSFSRIQFTPDLLPADVVGTMIYNQQKAEFVVKHGPIFANFVLADEINRAPAKVQSALLEAMQERQVTLGDKSYTLQQPFLVLATQNPVEQEGTYTLPEAQADRFMMKVLVDYPSKAEELHIMRQNVSHNTAEVNKVLSTTDIANMVQAVRLVNIDERIENYILDIVHSTRPGNAAMMTSVKNMLSYGASPRASIALANAAKASAFIAGRNFVLPEDVRACCWDVLRHRIGLSYEAEATGISADQVISKILDNILVP
jgi:MoxR-like ATPase